MDPILRISYGPNPPQYGPSSYARDLDSQAAEAQWILDNRPDLLAHQWPFSKMGDQGATENARARIGEAFDNPIPKKIGEPAMYGHYQIGYLPAHFSSEPYGGGSDEYIADMLKQARVEGLLSDDAAARMEENILDSDEDDYMELVQAGDLSLEEAIRMMGRVPSRLKGLIEE